MCKYLKSNSKTSYMNTTDTWNVTKDTIIISNITSIFVLQYNAPCQFVPLYVVNCIIAGTHIVEMSNE